MKKGDLVVELGDEACHVGVYILSRPVQGRGRCCLVRWNKLKTTWVRRDQLRLANPQEVVSYNSLHTPTLEQYASAL